MSAVRLPAHRAWSFKPSLAVMKTLVGWTLGMVPDMGGVAPG